MSSIRFSCVRSGCPWQPCWAWHVGHDRTTPTVGHVSRPGSMDFPRTAKAAFLRLTLKPPAEHAPRAARRCISWSARAAAQTGDYRAKCAGHPPRHAARLDPNDRVELVVSTSKPRP